MTDFFLGSNSYFKQFKNMHVSLSSCSLPACDRHWSLISDADILVTILGADIAVFPLSKSKTLWIDKKCYTSLCLNRKETFVNKSNKTLTRESKWSERQWISFKWSQGRPAECSHESAEINCLMLIPDKNSDIDQKCWPMCGSVSTVEIEICPYCNPAPVCRCRQWVDPWCNVCLMSLNPWCNP